MSSTNITTDNMSWRRRIDPRNRIDPKILCTDFSYTFIYTLSIKLKIRRLSTCAAFA